MSQSTIFLHIGMPKAASSYLHGAVFPKLMPGRYIMPGAANAKLPGYQFRRNAFSVRRFSDSFHQPSDFWHQHGEEFLTKFLSPCVNAERQPHSVLVSDEAVTRLNHFNIRKMPKAFEHGDIEDKFRLFAESARNIGFDRVKVLLIIRRQDCLLASSYAQLSRKIVGASQRDFEKRVHRLIEGESCPTKSSFYSVDYYNLYQSLSRSLAKENVMVMPLEKIVSKFRGAMKSMTEFFDITEQGNALSQLAENSRSAGSNRWGLRSLLLFKSSRGKFEITAPRRVTGRAEHIALTSRLSGDIMRCYERSNRELARLLDTDLGQFGYCSH